MTAEHSLDEEVSRLRDALDWVLQQPALTAAAPLAPWRWDQLDDTAARTAWHELTTWVDWLTNRYLLEDTIPSCWYDHGPIVEELTALHLAWTGAYTSAQAHPGEPAHWHDQLQRTLGRIRSWDRHGCTSGRHEPDVGTTLDPSAHARRETGITADVTRRAANSP